MKPLETTKRVLTWLCVCPADESTSIKQKKMYAIFTFMVCFSCISGFLGSVAFFIKFMKSDLENSLIALIVLAACAAIIIGIIVAFLFRHKINEIFEDLSTIYSACKY